jgi:RND family efflux transporter MFP subunit
MGFNVLERTFDTTLDTMPLFSRVCLTVFCYLLIGASPLFADNDASFIAQTAPQKVTLSGFTHARRALTVISESAGRCTKVYADVGEPVPADGILACLDDTFIRLDQQANQVEQQRLNAEIAYYNKEIRRLKKLTQANSASQAELDRMTWNRDNSHHQLQAHKVNAQRLAEQRKRSCIQAPAGWLLTQRHIEVGQWVASGQSIAQVGDFSALLVPMALSASELAALREEPIRVTISASGLEAQAHIARRSPAFNPETRKIQIDLEIVSDAIEHGGERVEVSLDLPGISNIVEVPRSALVERYEEHYLSRPGGELVKVTLLGAAQTEDYLLVSGTALRGQLFLSNVQNTQQK